MPSEVPAVENEIGDIEGLILLERWVIECDLVRTLANVALQMANHPRRIVDPPVLCSTGSTGLCTPGASFRNQPVLRLPQPLFWKVEFHQQNAFRIRLTGLR